MNETNFGVLFRKDNVFSRVYTLKVTPNTLNLSYVEVTPMNWINHFGAVDNSRFCKLERYQVTSDYNICYFTTHGVAMISRPGNNAQLLMPSEGETE